MNDRGIKRRVPLVEFIGCLMRLARRERSLLAGIGQNLGQKPREKSYGLLWALWTIS
jgi:hypothetical protein